MFRRRTETDGAARPPARRWAIAVLVALTAAASACGRGEQAPPSRAAAPPAPPAFVGRAVCAGCHEGEARAFRGSHHDRAMQPASPGTVLGDFGGSRFTHRGVTTAFVQRDGKFLVETEGPEGRTAEFEIAYTFGVAPLQQYLVPFPGGRLQALGVAWDTRPRAAGGQRWYSLYPGERLRPGDPLHWTGREQTWNYQCAECHSTDLRKNYDLAGNRYATTWAEVSLGCEACHGPGSTHVTWARGRAPGASRAAGADSGLVVRLGRIPGAWEMKDPARGIARWTGGPRDDREVDACARCHARRRPLVDPYPYGRPFLDTHQPALLDDGLYYADGQILGEVYEYGSFLQSRMHRAGVTCSDCHDPHGLGLRAPGSEVCARCHLPARFESPAHHHHQPGTEGARCVSCHMPARMYMGVDLRRDHGFRVPRPDLSVEIGTPNVCTRCHAGKPAAWAARVVDGWLGAGRVARPQFAQALDAGRRGRLDAEPRLAALATDPEQPGIARATALAVLPDFLTPASVPALEAGLRDPDPLVRVAATGAAGRLPPERLTGLVAPGLRDPVRAVRIAAARALAGAARSLGPERQRDFEGALAELVASELASAERPESHLNLSTVYARLGRIADAESELRTALWLDPRFVPALINLADLFRARERDNDGERFLEQALGIEPEHPQALHALGLLRVRQGRRDEAVSLFRRAAARRPESTRLGYVYAVALHADGHAAEALAVLEALHRRRPADRDVLAALVSLARERGDLPRARRHADTLAALLPGDPEVQRLRETLRSQTRRP